jgi:dGTPase
VKIELTGYKVLYDLLSVFIPAILKEKKDAKDEKILSLIPKQFFVESTFSDYYKVMGVLDYISGMTDTFATQLYKDLHGIHIAKHS